GRFAPAFGLLAAFAVFAASVAVTVHRAAAHEALEAGAASSDGSIGTTLLQLRWHAFDLAQHGANAGTGSAIAARGDRVLVAEPAGRFFEARLAEGGAGVRR